MIVIALGANLPSRYGTPEETLKAAIERLECADIRVLKASSVWLTAPVPVSDQPWYRNAVVCVETPLSAVKLMALLHEIEAEFGRERGEKNAARVLDLDIIAYGREIHDGNGLNIPHPRMHERAFVLKPLQEIAPEWIHPVSGGHLIDLIDKIPDGQDVEKAA